MAFKHYHSGARADLKGETRGSSKYEHKLLKECLLQNEATERRREADEAAPS